MKKYLKLLFIILIPLIICACEDNGKREGKLIEISALELTRNFHGENSKDFIFATVNEHKKGYGEFLESLKKLVKETNQTIYYVYYQHIDTEASLYILSKALISTVPWDDCGNFLRFSVTYDANSLEDEIIIMKELKKRLLSLNLLF
jgi:hypothetical protein